MNKLTAHVVLLLADRFEHIGAGATNARGERQSVVDQLGLLPINHVRFYTLLSSGFHRALYLSMIEG